MQTNPRPSHKAGRYAMLDLRHTGIPSIQAVRKKMEKKTRVGLYWTNSFQLTTVVNRPLHSTTGLPEGKAHRPWSISTWATQTDLLIAWCQTCVCQNGLATQARLYKVHQSQPWISWQLSQCWISLLDQTCLLISPQVRWPKHPKDRKNFILEGLLAWEHALLNLLSREPQLGIDHCLRSQSLDEQSQPMRPVISDVRGKIAQKPETPKSGQVMFFVPLIFGHIYCTQAVNCEDARCIGRSVWGPGV